MASDDLDNHDSAKIYDTKPADATRDATGGTVNSEAENDRRNAADTFNDAEASAAAEPDDSDARTREKDASGGGFISKVAGDFKNGSKKRGFAFAFKKYRTMIFILALLGCGGGGVLTAQSLLGYNLVSRLLDETNSQFITNNLRAPTVFRYAVENNKLSDAQKEDLKKYGIEIVEEENGKKLKKPKVRFIDDRGKTITTSPRKAFKNNSFRIKWDSASQTFAGQYAGQHDSLTVKLRKLYDWSVDNWHDWRSDTKDDTDQNKRRKFREIVKEKLVSKFSSGASRAKTQEGGEGEGEEGDGDGKENKGEVKRGDSKAQIKTTLTRVASTALGGAAALQCGHFAINVVLNSYTMGISLSNAFPVALIVLEAIQKTQAGDGSEAPYYEALETLTAINPKTGTSALEDSGLGYVLSGGTGKISSGTESNLEELFVAGKQTVADFSSCAKLSVAASVGNLALSVFSGGLGGSAKKALTKAVVVFGSGTVGALIIKGAIESYIDHATDAIRRELDVSESLSGKAYGGDFYNGSVEIIGRTAQVGGASYLNADMVEQYEGKKQAVLDSQAEYERATKSPFDTSSRNTFLGSLVNNSLFPFAMSISSSSIGSVMSQSSAVLSNSITSMLPSANAVGATHVLTAQDECPIANSAGAVGYPHCPTYRGTDTSTIDDDCDQECVIRYLMDKYHPFEETDFTLSPTIKEDTNLRRYQLYCGLRSSQVGLFDGNITAQIDEETAGTELASAISGNTVLALLPFVGDIAAAVTAMHQAHLSQWIDGSACVAGNENWDEYKWYQRFLEDQRLMVNMGVIEESAGDRLVTAYLEKHPVDNSREGVIARLSGLTKDTVIALEDELFYEDYLANDYHPEDLGPVYHEDFEAPINLAVHTPTSNIDDTDALALERVVYSPLQARVTTV
ncbi:hypothetical protein IKF33_01360 [Candidatus Saccharibacteria bacterium]|nr:hypothetical protein [Candidatus Saccharibacteria bacterium]